MPQIPFEFRHLHAYITLVETGSFTAAAKKLNQTQSAISQLVANLESNLNARLIDRTQRPFKLTVTGQELYQHGLKLLVDGKQLEERIYAIEKGEIPHLRIGVVDSIGQVIGLPILKYLKTRVNKIEQVNGTAPDLLQALEQGKIDLALTLMYAQVPEKIALFPLIEEEYIIVAPKSWQDLSLKTLCNKHDYIAYAGWTPTGSQTLNWLRWHGFKPNIQFEIARADNVLELIAEGYGWTLATPLFLAHDAKVFDQLQSAPLPHASLSRSLAIMSRNGELDNFIPSFACVIKKSLQEAVQPFI